MTSTEAELARFREEWREEVQTRTRGPGGAGHNSNSEAGPSGQTRVPKATQQRVFHDDDIEPRTYHDVEPRDYGRKLDDPSCGTKAQPEPQTALEHYERAVEREGSGKMGDSLTHYRKAFKLDPKVQDKWRSKHVPQAHKHTKSNPTNTAVNTPAPVPRSQADQTKYVSELVASFSNELIHGEDPPTEFSPSPPCPIAAVPDEVLVEILLQTALADVAAFSRLSQVCRRLAYLVASEDRIWKVIAHDDVRGFGAMHYDYASTVDWEDPVEQSLSRLALDHPLDPAERLTAHSVAPSSLPLTSVYPTYRQMFRSRPRIRFNGCYISTVNYTRPGAVAANSLNWNPQVLIVTYYRYIRFFPDGTMISLLSTAEPQDVVQYLLKEYVHNSHQGSALPQSVMKDALKGRWRLSGDPYGANKVTDQTHANDIDAEGEVFIETEGVVPKYKYIMQLHLGSAGRGARNNKMSWAGFWSYNKLTDDLAEFTLKNDRPFFWSRVRSWT